MHKVLVKLTIQNNSGSALGDLLRDDKQDDKSSTTTPKPKEEHKSPMDNLSVMFDDLKKKFFGDASGESRSSGLNDKKDKKDDKKGDKKDDKNGEVKKEKDDKDDDGSRGSDVPHKVFDTSLLMGQLVAKNAHRYIDQGVHLAINSAGNFLNKTAYKAAELTNAGIEQSALFATKMNNLEAELPAKAFEKLSQLDCNTHPDTLSNVCPKPDAKKQDEKKSDRKNDNLKKKDKKSKDSSRDELPELEGESSEAKNIAENDLIAKKSEIRRIDAEKKAEVENLKDKLESMKKNPAEEDNSRSSKQSLAIATPGHPKVAVSSPGKSAIAVSTTDHESISRTKRPRDKESSTTTTKKPDTADKPNTTTTGKPSSNIQISGSYPEESVIAQAGPGEERTGLNSNRIQTKTTTTTSIKPPNLFDSIDNIVKSIVPPAVPNYKTVDTKTVTSVG